jgi:threonine/homoserine efflux transporter RhtA
MVAIVLVIAASAGVTVTGRQARIPAVPETG